MQKNLEDKWVITYSRGSHIDLLVNALIKNSLVAKNEVGVTFGVNLEDPLKLSSEGTLTDSPLVNGATQLTQVLSNTDDTLQAAATWVHKGLIATHWLSHAEFVNVALPDNTNIDGTESNEIEFPDTLIETDQFSMPAANNDNQILNPLSEINPFTVVTSPVWGLQSQMGFVH